MEAKSVYSPGVALSTYLADTGWVWNESKDQWEKPIGQKLLSITGNAMCQALNVLPFHGCIHWILSHEMSVLKEANAIH